LSLDLFWSGHCEKDRRFATNDACTMKLASGTSRPDTGKDIVAAKAGAPAGGLRRRGRPRREQVDRLNESLLTHALDHFLDKGFEGTTLNAITSSLGMSKQTVYARYSDKLALFRAVLERAIDEWLVPLRNLRELERDDLEQSLNAIARVIVQTLMSPMGLKLIRITNAESFRMPEIGEYTYRRGLQQIGHYLADFFRRRIFSGHPDDPDADDLATTFLNLLSSPARVNAWGLVNEEIDIDDFVARRVRLFLHGVRPVDGEAAQAAGQVVRP
jgi:AcrR family transcriptional regulator